MPMLRLMLLLLPLLMLLLLLPLIAAKPNARRHTAPL